MSDSAYLQMQGISKRFPGVVALDHVDLELREGEVLALVGENGAGKSTLVKVLAGVHLPDEGELIIDGQSVQMTDTRTSVKHGVAIVHQELNLIPNLSIAENIFIGRDISRLGIMQKKTLLKESKKHMERVGLGDFDPNTLVGSLSIAHQQMVEIAKAVSVDAKIMILDEPTSSLTDQETEILFQIIRAISKTGTSIIYISHRMEEIFAVCDRIFVMRDGRKVGYKDVENTNVDEIINMMVGRDIGDQYPRHCSERGEVRLRVDNLVAADDKARNICFDVCAGEVLGISGLVGAGRTETVRGLFGIDKLVSGEIEIDGKRVKIRSPKDAIRAGMGFIPEDRKEQALILGMTVRENISLTNLKSLYRGVSISKKLERDLADVYIERLGIKTPTAEQLVCNLSGGNQQKVVIAKWLSLNPKILILDEPTRGIDVNSKREIYLLINKLVENGVAIILISSEMPEIIGMSDRVLVMHEGNMKAILSGDEISEKRIMSSALSN